MALHCVILAAGQGTRMYSALPKVLHPVGGRPMLAHVVAAAQAFEPERIHVVYGHGGKWVKQALSSLPVNWVEQGEQLGTGHAVQQALLAVPDSAQVLVLYGDVPLVSETTLRALAEASADGDVALLTADMADPAGYGRVLRGNGGSVHAVVEEKDATDEQCAITEINTGLLAAPAKRLRVWLAQVGNDNAQGEYYLPDIIGLAVKEGVPVRPVPAATNTEVMGINNKMQLAAAERRYQQSRAEACLRAGLTLADPARFDVRGEFRFGRDCSVDVNAVFEGSVHLGSNVTIDANCSIRDTEIGDGSHILPHTVLDGVRVGTDCQVGPFARLRPGTELDKGARVGNFVETKKAVIGAASKVNHLSYVGDADVGRGVNVGAGCITCNYDGVNKHKTVIEDGAFIGSDCQLVAPVTVGANATVGAGTTVSRDAPAGKLTVGRARQQTIQDWQPPGKKEA
jgi:bifunctional UDP-N-acetylglucosamine pyrophosphorylase/glucosamine-1-phosphate N-acetyltransferase